MASITHTFILLSCILCFSSIADNHDVISTAENDIQTHIQKAQDGDSDSQVYLMNHYFSEEHKDVFKGLYWLRMAADNERSVAQAFMGHIYLYGKVLNRDLEKALKWLRLASEQNEPMAHYDLGYMYRYGEGVKVDFKKAFSLYSAALEGGHEEAICELGLMHYRGFYVPQNYNRSMEMAKTGGMKGLPICQILLAIQYKFGEGPEQSYEKALAWYTLASISNTDARQFKEDLQITLSNEQINASQKIATELFEQIKQNTQ